MFFTEPRLAQGEGGGGESVALVFPWHDIERQVVVTGAASPVTDAEADAYFALRPRGSQLGALASLAVAGPAVRARRSSGHADELAALQRPGGELVPRPERRGGLRVEPDAVEFWQGREDRLHDRLRFRRDGGGWVVERLAPVRARWSAAAPGIGATSSSAARSAAQNSSARVATARWSAATSKVRAPSSDASSRCLCGGTWASADVTTTAAGVPIKGSHDRAS